MKISIIVLLAIIALLMLLCYSLLVIASEEDRRADRMYRAWKMQSIGSNFDAENAKYTFGKGADDGREQKISNR